MNPASSATGRAEIHARGVRLSAFRRLERKLRSIQKTQPVGDKEIAEINELDDLLHEFLSADEEARDAGCSHYASLDDSDGDDPLQGLGADKAVERAWLRVLNLSQSAEEIIAKAPVLLRADWLRHVQYHADQVGLIHEEHEAVTDGLGCHNIRPSRWPDFANLIEIIERELCDQLELLRLSVRSFQAVDAACELAGHGRAPLPTDDPIANRDVESILGYARTAEQWALDALGEEEE